MFSLALASLAGCASSQAYVPFQQPSTLSVEARWQALQILAQSERWTLVETDRDHHQVSAYRNSEVAGVRDRIKVVVLADRTVVETASEIEDNGRWKSTSCRCSNYNFVREKVLLAHLEDAAAIPPRPVAAPRKVPELVLPASRSTRTCRTGVR